MASHTNRALAPDSAGTTTGTSTTATSSHPISTVSDPGRGYTQGPGYGYGQPGQISAHQYQQYHYTPNSGQLQSVMMTQPVYVTVGPPPNTTCPLIMSAISALFCGFLCGAAGIVFSWKARMQSLKRKYEEANHSICIAWIFFALAFIFGFIIWGTASVYIILYNAHEQHYYP